MDFATIMQAVSSIGFPIVVTFVLLWYIKDINERHDRETERFTESLNNNTLVLQKLCDKLDAERGVDE